MRILSASISGYRSLQEVEIELADLTACIGPNGSGKSSFLGALRLFFQPSSQVDEFDFWSGAGDEKAELISIKVTLTELSDGERDTSSEFMDAETESLTFERRFEEPGKGIYLAQRLAVPEFSKVRMLQRSHREEYNGLVVSNQFEGLQTATSEVPALNM